MLAKTKLTKKKKQRNRNEGNNGFVYTKSHRKTSFGSLSCDNKSFEKIFKQNRCKMKYHFIIEKKKPGADHKN